MGKKLRLKLQTLAMTDRGFVLVWDTIFQAMKLTHLTQISDFFVKKLAWNGIR